MKNETLTEKEKLYKKLMSACRGCENKEKDGPYNTCRLVPGFYPNAILASVAQGQCERNKNYELYDLYMKMVERDQKMILAPLLLDED